MKKSDIFWQTYLSLEKELINVSNFIFITDEITTHERGLEVTKPYNSQMETFSPHIADLLIRCCVQIEAISKELYYENGGTKPRGDKNLFFDEDCLKLIDIKWATHDKRVLVVAPFFNLTKDENRVLRPLKNAHKRSGTFWEKAYQAVKHDRFLSLKDGNVKALLHSMAALYLLNLYYRNDSWVVKYQELSKSDFSMGSSIFAVKQPEVGQLWYGNNPIASESPYVVRYQAEDYKRIEAMQKADSEALSHYWQQQPELKDPEFLAILARERKKQEMDPTHRILYLWELGIYRLKKQLPTSLPFEERRNRFIKSEAWNCWINQHNTHLNPEDITDNNIDEVIENVGRLWGMDIEKRYNTMNWIHLATNGAICKVYIP
ncbi:MAG: hypothetical protein IJ607_08760 [Bacteroidaceae bacterium]|nr:hypothetical protein [Bacteroidaceae bacterium]